MPCVLFIYFYFMIFSLSSYFSMFDLGFSPFIIIFISTPSLPLLHFNLNLIKNC